MYKVGDYVIYGYNGLCRIQDITELDMSGTEKKTEYYCLVPVGAKDSLIYAPVGQSKVPMRSPLTEEEALALIDSAPEMTELWIGNEKLREEKYREALKSDDSREWMRILKTMYHRRHERLAQGRKTTSVDERYQKAAEDNLYTELAYALGKTRDEMEEYITERIEGK